MPPWPGQHGWVRAARTVGSPRATLACDVRDGLLARRGASSTIALLTNLAALSHYSLTSMSRRRMICIGEADPFLSVCVMSLSVDSLRGPAHCGPAVMERVIALSNAPPRARPRPASPCLAPRSFVRVALALPPLCLSLHLHLAHLCSARWAAPAGPVSPVPYCVALPLPRCTLQAPAMVAAHQERGKRFTMYHHSLEVSNEKLQVLMTVKFLLRLSLF